MSRSYKKHPRVKDSADKFMKKYANKKIRHAKDVPAVRHIKKFLNLGIFLIGIGYGQKKKLKELGFPQMKIHGFENILKL